MEANEHIRSFPFHLSESVKQFTICTYFPMCRKGEKCTYAHSEKEKLAWNTELRKRRKRARPCVDTVVQKKPKITVSSTAESTSSHSESHQLSNFVETKVFKELLEKIKDMPGIGDVNNIQIFGPKGTGKTCALLRLKELFPETAHYIDLAVSKSVDFNSKILLIDNAQLFTPTLKGVESIRTRTVIAAFSPGANMSDGCKDLSKCCGDGKEIFFYWRPFAYEEVVRLVGACGFSLASETDLQNKKISEQKLKVVFCKTNGNPRFINRYFAEKHLNYMVCILNGQYKSMIKIDGLGGPKRIRRSLIALLKTGDCHLWDIPSVVGAAYCTSSDGGGKWKLAHPLYAFMAIEELGWVAFKMGERWQQLESITQLILATDVKVLGKKSELNVKGWNKTIHQSVIGDIPNIDDCCVTLLILACKHNVIDNILYDCRGTPIKVYFVQTSSMPYSSKKKGKECLTDPAKENATDKSNGKPMINHYTDFLPRTINKYYIYATTDCSRSAAEEDVYFLDLLAFCFDTSSKNYMLSDGDD